MSSSNQRLNNILQFVEAYNATTSGHKITPLKALKIYLELEKKQG